MSTPNPLASLEAAAKGAVQTVVDWAYSSRHQRSAYSKSDRVFSTRQLDTLRRAAKDSVFDYLFLEADKDPYINADNTIEQIIGKLAKNMFPKATTYTVVDETTNLLLNDIISDLMLAEKTQSIVSEASLMGWCALRSVYVDEFDQWVLEVKPKEYTKIQTYNGWNEKIFSVTFEWPEILIENEKPVIYWYKERWTDFDYTTWIPKRQGGVGKPQFKESEALPPEENTYGEIPVTIVPHIFDAQCFGRGIVDVPEILAAKSLIRLRNKRHFGHMRHIDPTRLFINIQDDELPDPGIGGNLSIKGIDPSIQAEVKLLESNGMPDSVADEIYDHVKMLYQSAGLKPPTKDEALKIGTNDSGVALRIKDKDDWDLIDSLRDEGYARVLRHLEKILRMGKNLNLPEYRGINPENPDTYLITAKYPSFFPPTDDEVAVKIANMRAANLPPDIIGRAIAALFGIEDQKEIQAVIDSQAQAEEFTKPLLNY